MTARDLAPAAFAAWDELEAAVVATTPAELVELAGSVAGAALGTSAAVGEWSAAVAWGEQVVVDVASLTGEVRAAGVTQLGAGAAGFVLALWSADMKVRANRAFRELVGEEPLGPVAAPAGPDGDPWSAQGRFLAEVAKLSALDPVSTELVRLRGARAHACRLCQSRRDVTAIEAAGRADLFEADDPTEVTEGQALALKVVDTFVWEPLRWPHELGPRTAALLGPSGAVELVLDIVRNAANKIAVAFGADAPQVDGGVEYFAIDHSTGELRYDVS